MNTVFKELSDPTRRRVLQLLRARPMAAGERAGELAVPKPTMSRHIAVLRGAGLVDGKSGRSRRVGPALRSTGVLLGTLFALHGNFLPKLRSPWSFDDEPTKDRIHIHRFLESF